MEMAMGIIWLYVILQIIGNVGYCALDRVGALLTKTRYNISEKGVAIFEKFGQ